MSKNYLVEILGRLTTNLNFIYENYLTLYFTGLSQS